MSRFRIHGHQETSHDGHFIIYGETLDNFAGNLPQDFERWFDYTCPVQSTSFMFKVTFRRASNDGGVDCDIIVRRTDTHHVLVNGDFWISASTSLPDVFEPRRTIRLPRMPRNSHAVRTVRGFIPNDILTRLGDRNILFQAAMGIHGCHREEDTEVSKKRNFPPPVPPLPAQLRMLSKM